jgi:hypothetical protein
LHIRPHIRAVRAGPSADGRAPTAGRADSTRGPSWPPAWAAADAQDDHERTGARNLASVSATDAFGKRGWRELAEVCLPVDEREQLASTLRLHDAIDAELAEVERESVSRARPVAIASRYP